MTVSVRLVAALMAGWCCLMASADGGLPLVRVGDQSPAPDFALKGPDGRTYRLADYRGKPIILNFWATWCPPCRAEMPSMERAHQRLSRDGIALIAVNVGDDVQAIREFLTATPVSFPLPMDLDSSVAQLYPLIGLPTTFVIDPKGRLIYSATGEQEWDDPAVLEQVMALTR
jgi:peroxiredoxin